MDNKELFGKWWNENVLGIQPEPEPQQVQDTPYPCVKDGGSVLATQPPAQPSTIEQFEKALMQSGF